MADVQRPVVGYLPPILLITRNLPPLRGGMERVNLHLALEIAGEAKLSVIGPKGCREYFPDGVEVIELPLRPLPVFLMRAFVASWRMAGNRPGIVIAGSGLTAPMARLVARRAGAKAVAYVHGLDLVARHWLYRAFWLSALRRLDHAFANSSNTADIASRMGVAGRRVSILHPGVSIPDDSGEGDLDFRRRYSLGAGPLLLSVGRMTERKGLIEFVSRALPAICARYPEVTLVVIGDEAPDALNGRGAGAIQRLLEAAAEQGLEDHLRVLGTCDDPTLSEAYFASDVHVFPVRQVAGDIEGFGMVAMEAAAHGLPTVAFALGGVPDAVHPGRSGYLVNPGDYERFADSVCELLSLDRHADIRRSARELAEEFRWERFGERLRSVLSRIAAGDTFSMPERHGHAVLDVRSRNAKARKIERLLGLKRSPQRLRVLEIGTGSGGIAYYFATHSEIACEVDAVDVADTRQIRDGYRFTLVDSPLLPFDDACFDIVITNHVIEHVGNEAAQCLHLDEVRRVMKPDGMGYLAVPNRWMLVEPHYRLAFLSWLPRSWRTPYLSWRGRGKDYDCRPLTTSELEPLLRHAGFDFMQQHARALRLTYELERPKAFIYRRVLKRVPDAIYRWARRGFPTLIYVLRPVLTPSSAAVLPEQEAGRRTPVP